MITLQVFNNTNRLYTLLNSHTVTLICMCKQRFLPTIVRSAFFHATYRNSASASLFVPSERNFFHCGGVLLSGSKSCMRCDPASALHDRSRFLILMGEITSQPLLQHILSATQQNSDN